MLLLNSVVHELLFIKLRRPMMKKLLQRILGLFFFAALMGSPPADVPKQFQLRAKVKLCGVELEPGQYHLVLHEGLADIYKGEDRLVTAKAKVTPMGRHEPRNTVYYCKNVLMVVRLEKVKVTFPEPLGKPVVSGSRAEALH
jgi:hypothetical protein